MIIKKARVLGYCMGVRKAVDIVYSAVREGAQKPIYTFGPIIHNRVVIEDLKGKGVKVLEDSSLASGTVIIRAHGVRPNVKKSLEEKAIVIDATCPRVVSSQQIVSEHSSEGYHIIIVGDKNHGEVKGLEGFGENCRVIESEKEAKELIPEDKTLVIAQTTFYSPLYERIAAILKEKNPGIKKVESICPMTRSRQEALKELSREVDAILVIGGKNSANTKRLFQTAQELCKNCWHIEDHTNIPEEIFSFSKIGISAGASTPDWVIDAVEDALSR